MSKAEERKIALAARRALIEPERESASRAICAKLLALPEVQRAKTVLSYLALWDEVDLTALHEAMEERGVRLCFPVSLPGGVLEVYEPRGFVTGAYGIREPDRAVSVPVSPGELDLVLCPCVGFDDRCRRLGHGAGYYDRYLPRCQNAFVLAVAFDCQRLPCVETDAHDFPMDAVVTERLGGFGRSSNPPSLCKQEL